MKRIDVDPYTHLLIVKFRFLNKHWKEEMQTKRNILSLQKRSYSRGLNVWMVPPTRSNIENLWAWEFSFPEDFSELVGHDIIIKKIAKPSYHDIKLPKYLDFLRPYQKEAVQFIKYKNGRALIADDMGVGKTVEAIGWIKWNIKNGPALIIVPASTKLQWEKSYHRWIDKDVEIIYGKTPHNLTRRSYIINWDILKYWEKNLSLIPFYSCVADESQFSGNISSGRTKALINLAKHIPSFIPMSGTPIETKVKQFFPTLHLVDKKLFSSEWKYLNRYCVQNYGNSYSGSAHVEELHVKVSGLMIRRMKRDVLKDLPPLIRSVVPMSIGKYSNKYNDLETIFFDTYATHSLSKLEEKKLMGNLKLKIFDMKFTSICLWINEFLLSDKKLVVGVWHRYVIDRLYSRYRDNAVKINGTVTGIKREKTLEDFYNNKDICFLQIKSGGIGLDGLQHVCSDAAIIELATPKLIEQFESRLERDGQKEPMSISYLLGKGTIEEDLLEAFDEVRKMIDSVIDGKRTESKDLLKILYEKRKRK